MSLLNKVANQEIFDFLRTVTVKSTYFANKIRTTQIRQNLESLTPETANPYTIHLAGEYVLDPRKFSVPEEVIFDPPCIKGYRRTKDTRVKQYKNYWQLVNDHSVRRMGTKEMERITSPVNEGLYELQPMIVPGIIDPITGKPHDQEYSGSQMIYDRDGFLATEMRNCDLFVDGIYDEMMYVTSLDTGQVIPFTLENFYVDCALAAGLPETAVHTKTLEAYKVPGRYFDLLCQKYPKQVDLIKAIVYRVPDSEISSLVTMPELKKLLNATIKEVEEFCETNGIASAYALEFLNRFKNNKEALDLFGKDIEGGYSGDEMSLTDRRRTYIAKAANFTLLNCDLERLDNTEKISLREHVVEVCDIFRRRWSIDEYNIEENYAAVLWTAFWTVLPMTLIAKRYANIKTPYVSMGHMWDYLISKGLGEYKGYLTEKQTWFMYKNINYLLQHAGQQRAMNILIDNILADYGITLKAKTVVLDSTKSLSLAEVPALAKSQCATCARNGVTCFKNITTYMCDEWLGTKTLCKAEPVVLTEEFAGASKEKVINELIKSHGYDPIAAEVKYKRSFIWRDDEVEAIKDDLDRDQIVDMSGKIESLETTIDIEHNGGQEPVVNDDIVEEQRVALRNMHGTYAPTKLLEMVRRSYNAKFSALFNRFITETFLRLAPKMDESGALIPKVTFSYKFETTEGASEYILSFGEMLAASYLCFCREFWVDCLVDKITTYVDDEGITRPLYEFAKDDNGNRIQVGTDRDGNPVYLKKLASWIQQRYTDMMNEDNYDFAIPTKAKTHTAIKFGKPIKQNDLVTAYKESVVELTSAFDPISNIDQFTKLVLIGDTYYAVTGTAEITDRAWEDSPIMINSDVGSTVLRQLKILGQYTPYREGDQTKYAYHENDDEIAIIPTFFRWYYTHLTPDFDLEESEKKQFARNTPVVQKLENGVYTPAEVSGTADGDTNQAYDPTQPDETASPQVGVEYVDPDNGNTYRIFRMSDYLDVDSILSEWVDLTGTITEQSKIAEYIDKMFAMLESIYCMASASGSIRTHVACSLFLDLILKKDFIHFDLTDTEKTHPMKDGSKAAWFSEWVGSSKELQASFKIIENLKVNSIGWNELSTAILNKLLEGCTIPFASSLIDNNQFNKLKKLVLQLSSYRITIIEEGDTDRECVCVAGAIEDTLLDHINVHEIIYFDPIGDSVIPPRVGGYTSGMSEYGHLAVPSTDIRRVEGKVYFMRTYRDSPIYRNPDLQSALQLVNRPLADDESSLSEGGIIKTSENGGEMIDVPIFKRWDGYEESKDKYAIVGRNYFKYVPESGQYVEVKHSEMEAVPVSECTDLPSDAVITETNGEQVAFLLFEHAFFDYKVGDLLPPGVFYEIVNIYEILGIEVGTPLLILRNDKYDWFYSVGTKASGEIKYPAANTTTEYCNGHTLPVEVTPDQFDLKNDFSNETYAKAFGSPVYRINVPTEGVEWGTPVKSVKLEKLLYPTVNHNFIVTTSKEHVMLIEQIRDIDNELNQGEET